MLKLACLLELVARLDCHNKVVPVAFAKLGRSPPPPLPTGDNDDEELVIIGLELNRALKISGLTAELSS